MNKVVRNIQLVAVVFILVGTVLAFGFEINEMYKACLLYTSPSPRDRG